MSETSEIFEKVAYVGRNTKVVKGGRRFSFSVIIVIGDKKGRVGVGLGKATEVIMAKEKAATAAKREMIRVPLREGRTLHHDSIGRFGAGKVLLRSAPTGTGIIAGGPVRSVLEALGIKDVVSKSLGSNNPHNMIKATLDALRRVNSPKFIADKRSLKVGEIVSRREFGVKSVSSEGTSKEALEDTAV